MFASVTPLDETLRADIRRARLWVDHPANTEALECAIHLAQRLKETDVFHLLRTALRRPDHRELLLALAAERMSR